MTTLDRAFWTRAVVVTAMVSGGVFFTNRFAKADPGGATRSSLTFAGTLSGVTGAQTLTFTFRKGSATVCAPTATVTPDAEGRFTAEIPIDGCPATLFDGADVTFDVRVGTTTVASGQRVNPVPYARYADQVGTPDCPVGYTRTTETRWVVCARTVRLGSTDVADEVVKVGDGRSAFWVDRYEASVHHATTGVQLAVVTAAGMVSGDPIVTSGLLENGRHTTRLAPAMALSHTGMPTVNVTWFQANEACRRAGKRLPTGSEWLAAASGTIDDPTCQTATGNAGPRAAAPTNLCVSAVGAHDMIGNVWEMTDEWYAAAGPVSGSATPINSGLRNWPSDYGDDGTYGVNGAVDRGGSVTVVGLPGAAVRGGPWSNGTTSGVFALSLSDGPSASYNSKGFRCVIPR